MWVRHARTRVVDLTPPPGNDGEVDAWTAEHDGYANLDPPAIHRRSVRLDRTARRFEIIDAIETRGAHSLRLTFHLGPTVEATVLNQPGPAIELRWPATNGHASATLHLPDALDWKIRRGEVDPIIGWYSPTFGVKHPTNAIVGLGTSVARARHLESALVFHD
jgi:hypothetical protein